MKQKRRKQRRVIEERRYNTGEIHDEREYGFFWYAWLWHILRKVLIAAAAVLIIIGIFSAVAMRIYNGYFAAVEPENQETIVFTIPNGASVSKVADLLVDAGLLKKDFVFRYIVQFKGLTNSIRYGTYTLSPSMNVLDLVDSLTGGIDTREVTITIIPGWTVEDIADYLVKTGLITDRNEFINVCRSADAFTDKCYLLNLANESGALRGRKYALEGYLAPDTYRVFATADSASVVRTLLSQTNKVVDEVFYSNTNEYVIGDDGEIHENERYESTLDENETLILASMIEKEAGSRADYTKVSAVFHNRLKAGMPLESDVTAAYITGETGYILSDNALNDRNAYNTYTFSGLPAGPICNPSKAAIKAALYPDLDYIKDGYLYFCAGEAGSGKLVFARTKKEHEANVAHYRESWVAYDNRSEQEKGGE